MRYRIKEESPTRFVVQQQTWFRYRDLRRHSFGVTSPVEYSTYEEAATYIRYRRKHEVGAKVDPVYHYVSCLPEFLHSTKPPPENPQVKRWDDIENRQYGEPKPEKRVDFACGGWIAVFDHDAHITSRITDLEQVVEIFETAYIGNRELTRAEAEIVDNVRHSIDK